MPTRHKILLHVMTSYTLLVFLPSLFVIDLFSSDLTAVYVFMCIAVVAPLLFLFNPRLRFVSRASITNLVKVGFFLLAMGLAALFNNPNISDSDFLGRSYLFYLLVGLPMRKDIFKRINEVSAKQEEAERAAQSQSSFMPPEEHFEARPPKYTFEDVQGMETLKSELENAVEQFKSEGGNGILLYGEPGNGKTYIAEALAGDYGANFLEARTQELSSRWLGHTSEKISQIFEDAKAQAPCLLFFDEIDSFLTDRNTETMHEEYRRIANTLLTGISELNKNFAEHRVLIAAATNFIDSLDSAGIREGRFDKKIEVYPPDYDARKGIVLNVIPDDISFEEDDIDQTIARWEGFSVVRIQSVAKEAVRMAKKENNVITTELMNQALRAVQGRKGKQLSENAKSLSELAFSENQNTIIHQLIKQLRNRHKIESRGGEIPKGALFYGPAGTGKTSIAQAIAKELDWAYISYSGQSLIENPREIDKMIRQAMDQRPALIFIDEAEDLLAERVMNENTRNVTNKLLEVMDGDRDLHDVFFIAATNHPENLDDAMLRWGRFSEILDFTPDAESLKKVIEMFIESRKEHIDFTGDINSIINDLAEQGFSPADVVGCLTRDINNALLESENDERVKVDLTKCFL